MTSSIFPDLDLSEIRSGSRHRTRALLWSDQSLIDEYSIELEFDDFFPKSFPKVFEMNGRIPQSGARHKNPDESCCIIVEDQKWEYSANGLCDLNSYLEGPVYNYFLSQSIFEISGKWIFGERPHYWPGVLEYYRKITDTQDVNVIVALVSLATQSQTRGHHQCPCPSGLKIRNCHLPIVQKLKSRIPVNRLLEVAKMLPLEGEK